MSPAKSEMSNVTSLDPTSDAFSSGRPDAFVGTFTKVRYAPYKFKGSKTGKYIGFAIADITPDDDSGYDPFTEHYQAFFLNGTAPSEDGIEPVGASMEEYAALGNAEGEIEDGEEENYEATRLCGRKPPKDSDWHQLLTSLKDAGFTNWGPGTDCVEGVRARFDRVSRKKQSANTQPGQQEFKVLVVTELLGQAAGSGKAAGKGKAKAGNAAATTGTTNGAVQASEDLSERVINAVVELLGKADDTQMARGGVGSAVVKQFTGKEKAAALALINNNDWLSNDERPWKFDAKSGQVSL